MQEYNPKQRLKKRLKQKQKQKGNQNWTKTEIETKIETKVERLGNTEIKEEKDAGGETSSNRKKYAKNKLEEPKIGLIK